MLLILMIMGKFLLDIEEFYLNCSYNINENIEFYWFFVPIKMGGCVFCIFDFKWLI